MYIVKFPTFLVKIECFIILYASNHTKEKCTYYSSGKHEERIQKTYVYRRRKFLKNGLGETECKNVDSIKWLSIGQGLGCIKSGDKASGSIKFRRFPE